MPSYLIRLLAITLFLGFSFISNAQTRYWVAAGAANWSGDNWSSASGGAPDGSGPPTAVQSARFDAMGLGNCTIDVLDPNIVGLVVNGYTGVIDLNGNTLTSTGTITLTTGTINDTPGTDSLVLNSAGTANFNGTIFGAIVYANSRSVGLNGSTFNARSTFIKNGTGNVTGTGGNTYNADVLISHSGANNFIFAGTNPDDFNGSLTVINSGTGTIYLSQTAIGNTYDGNIFLNSTGSNIFFGNNNGTSTLADGFSVSIGSTGFSTSTLRFRNFTQLGTTAQNLALTGTALLDIYDASWAGDVTFSSPRLFTRGTTYSGITSLTKNGATDDASVGGNRFNSNASLTLSGSGYFLMGNASPDTFDLDLSIINTGTDHFYLANNSAGNLLSGNLTATNSATGAAHIYIANGALSTLSITGNATFTSNASGVSNHIYFGNNGDISLGGDLSMSSASTSNVGNMYIASTASSAVTIGGNTTIVNSGAGTTKRSYLGSSGDVTFGGTLNITNSSTATNSQVYLNNAVSSVNTYNGNITIESTTALNDGFLFGDGGGSGTLAAASTISIGGGGFLGSTLTLRNFTQIGATAQTLLPSGVITYLTIYDCNWGGDVSFASARFRTRGTTYSGITTLEKTGATDDQSLGGNIFIGNATLNNSGSGYFLMGNGNPDTFAGDLDISNTGTRHIYLGYNSAGNTITGNFTSTNAGTGSSNVFLSSLAASTLTVNGTAIIDNSGNGVSVNTYVGDAGDIIFNNGLTLTNSASGVLGQILVADDATSSVSVSGDLIANNNGSTGSKRIYLGNDGSVSMNTNLSITNSNTSTVGEVYLGDGAASIITITGNTTLINDGSGTTRRSWLGNAGDVSFGGTLSITNNSDATNSEVYLQDDASSVNVYNGNIILESNDVNCDGILFGNSTGSGTLAATRTISIGGGGFLARSLLFRNFTQIGATAQTLAATGATSYITIYECNWGGDINFSSPQIRTRGTTYSGTATLTKTGATDNISTGGNTFTGNAILNNSGSGYFMMGNGNPDIFGADLDITNSGSRHFYLARQSIGNTVAGNFTATNSGTGTSYIYLAEQLASDLSIAGTAVITNSASGITNYIYLGDAGDVSFGSDLTIVNSSSSITAQVYLADNSTSTVSVTGNTIATNSGVGGTKRIYLGNGGPVTFGGDVSLSNSNTATTGEIYVGNGAASVVSITGNTSLLNDGAGTTRRTYLGNTGDVTFGGTLSITNNSIATNSEVYCNHGVSSVNAYNGNITLESTSASCDGVYFGNSTGSGTLAATRTISIGGAGFLADFLTLRNFTQIGPTAQTLQPSGPTTFMTLYDSNWGGDVIFSSAQITTRGTAYSGTSSLTKNGATDNASVGGNSFSGNTILNNSGSGYFMMGNGSPDTFGADLDITNSGTDHFFLARQSIGNTVAGNLTATNSGSGTSHIYFSEQLASDLSITGDVTVSNLATGITNNIYLGDAGDIVFGNDLTIINSPTSLTAQTFLADEASSAISINGNTSFINDGVGTSRRSYLGNNGDISFGGNLSITNNSTATESEVFCHHNAASVNTYAGNITLVSTSASCDGVFFGNSTGSGTLAATRTISIGGAGFLADFLTLRNFTQIGPTAQTLEPTGPTTLMTIHDSNWGGDIVFSSAQFTTRGTTYSGTSSLTKNGATDNTSQGGNNFVGNAILNNSGSGEVRMGSGNFDTYGGDLSMTLSGSDNIQLAYNSAGNTVSGNLTATNSATGTGSIVLSNTSAATLSITGTTTLINNATGGDARLYLGNTGDVTLGSSLNIDNSPTGASGYVYVANADGSVVSIAGNTIVTNSGAGTNKRVYLGEQGDITFNGTLSITNSSSATNSLVYCNNNVNSVNAYNQDIVLEVTNASCDGIVFGNSNGSGTLADTRTITIGGSGFIAGALTLRNFTQIGLTPQTLHPTGTTFMTIYDSNWGGNVDFSSPRILSRGTTYSGTASLEKTGATDDTSPGGNTFVGNAFLTNSGSGYWRFGSGSLDVFNANLDILNSGSRHFYFAYSGAGHLVSGDLTATNDGTGTSYIYICDVSSSSLTVNGIATFNNSGSGSDTRFYVGDDGDITFNSDLALNNTASGASGIISLANVSTSLVTVAGNTSVSNSGVITTKRIFVGNNGDVTFTGNLSIANSSSATNSQVYCNYGGNSSNLYNGNITIESTNASCDGVLFGNSGGSSTLAATRTITISGGGFIAGSLTLRNFTQLSATSQALHPTGTTIMTIINSNWEGDVDFSSPGISSLGTTYSLTASLDKTGSSNDRSAGGNTFIGNATIINSGTGYWRFGEGTTDSFNANLDLVNSGSNILYFAYSGTGHLVSGDLTATNSGTGTSYLYLANAGSSSLTVDGDVTITNSGSGSDVRTYIGNAGDVTFNSDLSIVNSASGVRGDIYMADDASSIITVAGNTTLTNSGANTFKRIFLGNQGDITFNGNLALTNTSTATNSQLYCNYEDNSTNNYNGDITIESTSASNDGILFGGSGGAAVLAATRTISIGGGGFLGANLYFRDFTQTGATAQTLAPTGVTLFTIYDCNWGGDVTFSSARITSRNTIYSSSASLEKNGATEDRSYGQNTFHGGSTFIQSGTGRWRLSFNVSNDFNGDVNYIKTGSGGFEPARAGTSTYAGNININFNSLVTLGDGTGIIEMNGIGAQSINDLASTVEPRFRRLVLNNPNDEITLNTPISISTIMTFTQGNINTTDANLLTVIDEAIVAGASNNSYVRGPIEKIGEDDFTFPVGDSGFYRPIIMSGGSGKNNATRFRGSYFEINPDSSMYTRSAVSGSIDHVSASEYWILDRIFGAASVNVTLSWDANSGTVDDLSELLVARYDQGTNMWIDHGNGGTTGNTSTGSIISLGTISSFSPFTLASTTINNPLPVTYKYFEASKLSNSNLLEWVTLSEINADYFDIEKSIDGASWNSIGSISANGNSTIENQYQFTDFEINEELIYYRLKQIDFDGTIEYSEIRKIDRKISGEFEMEIFPNPVSDGRVAIKLTSDKDEALYISILSTQGKLLYNKTTRQTNSFQRLDIDLSDFSKGTYFIRIDKKGGVVTKKLIIL